MTAPIPAELDEWVDAAARHLYEAVDTARDELARDRDFLFEGTISPTFLSPTDPRLRDLAIAHAMRRFLRMLEGDQEG
jgi:hypothetical protein